MIYLHRANQTDFRYNGIPLRNTEEAIVEEVLNGEFLVNMIYPITKDGVYKQLTVDSILTVPTPRGLQAFRIVNVKKKISVIEIEAHHVFYDLSAKLIDGFGVDKVMCQTALDDLFSRIKSQHPFAWYSDITTRHTLNYGEPLAATSVLMNGKHSILGLWQGELLRDNFKIYIKENIGSFKGSVLSTVTNISDFVHEIDFQNVVTRITATSTFINEDATNEEQKETKLTVVVDSPLINRYSTIREAKYENNSAKTEEELRNWAKLKFNSEHIDKPKASMEVAAYRLNGNQVELGDSVLVKVKQHDVDVVFKCTSYKYDALAKTYVSVGFGNPVVSFASGLSHYISDNTLNEQHVMRIVDSEYNRKAEEQTKNFERIFEQKQKEIEDDVKDSIEKSQAQAEVHKQAIQDRLTSIVNEAKNYTDDTVLSFDERLNRDYTRLQKELESNHIFWEAEKGVLDKKIIDTKTELTTVITSLNNDVFKKSEFSIQDGRIQLSTGAVIDGNHISSMLIAQPQAVTAITDKFIIAAQGVNIARSDLKNVCFVFHTNTPITSKLKYKNQKTYTIKGRCLGFNNSEGYVQFYLKAYYTDKSTENVRWTSIVTQPGEFSVDITFPTEKTIKDFEVFVYISPALRSATMVLCDLVIIEPGKTELIVDGTISGDKLLTNSIETGHLKAGSVTADILATRAVTADKMLVDTAMINKFTAHEALINNLVAKQAFINKVRAIDLDATRIKTGVLSGDRINGGTIRGITLQGLEKIKIGDNGFLQPVNLGLQINAPAGYSANYGVGIQIYGKREGDVPKGMFVYSDPNFSKGDTIPDNVDDFLITVAGKISTCNLYRGKPMAGLPINSNFRYDDPVKGLYRISYIGWEPDSGQLYVNDGTDSNGTWWFRPDASSSDIKLKENIVKSKYSALNIVNQLKFYEFDWIPDKFGYQKPHTKIGQIAQDLQQIDDSLVFMQGENLAIDDFRLLNIALKSIQELAKKIEELENSYARTYFK